MKKLELFFPENCSFPSARVQRGDHDDHPRDLRHDGIRPRPRKRRRGRAWIATKGPPSGISSTAASPARARPSPRRTPPPAKPWPRSRRARPRMWTPPSPPPPAPSRNGRSSPATSARNTSTRSPAFCRSMPASSPCWNPSTTASRSARRATSTSRSPSGISTTTRAWRSFLQRNFPAIRRPRRLRPDHPVELPAPDAGVEDRARARRREHRGSETRRIHLAHRASLRRYLPRGRAAEGRRQHRHRRRRDGAGDRRASRHRQDRLHRLHRRGPPIRETTAGTGKSLTLELGGKSPYIVFDDADIDSAIEGLVDAIWFNQGQVCCAGSRLLVQEGIAEDFHTRLKARMDKLRVGDPLDKCIDVGAVVDPVQHATITRLVDANTEGEVYRAATACRRRAASTRRR
jgi:hypothetical protein